MAGLCRRIGRRFAVSNPEKIAFVGLGQMGLPFACNLSEAGFDVIGFDRSEAARNAYMSTGGAVAEVATEAVSDAQIVITMLPDGKIVREFLTSPDLLASFKTGATIVDMSSSEPVGTQELGGILKAKGLKFIDAPVSGGVRRAREGTVAIIAGGESADIQAVRHVLLAIGNRIFEMGPLGSGHAVKALNNYVSAAGLQAASEALIVAQAFGIDPDAFIEVLNASTGRNNSTETKLKPFILSETFASGFSLSLMAKDIRTADNLAQSLKVSLPGLDAAANFWSQAAHLSGREADHTEIYKFIRDTINAGRSKSGVN